MRGVPGTLEVGLGEAEAFDAAVALEKALEVEDGASRPARGCNKEAL